MTEKQPDPRCVKYGHNWAMDSDRVEYCTWCQVLRKDEAGRPALAEESR